MPNDGDHGGGVAQDTKKHDIIIPTEYNYIGVFLTFGCQLRCPYCINREKGAKPRSEHLPGEEWIKALNRIQTRPDLPITLQGGEPTMHHDFYEIIKGVDKSINIDLLTNLQFDVEEFSRHIPPDRIKRNAPYASIRVSFHPYEMELTDTIDKVKYLLHKGYSIGVWIVNNPKDKLIKVYQQCFLEEGIDCRLKEYLDGKDYGTYKYMHMQGKNNVLCRPSEVLVAPDGSIHRCHGDLYRGKKPYAHIQDDEVILASGFHHCKRVECNSCDIKVKTNRFQEYGHCSVEIKEKL